MSCRELIMGVLKGAKYNLEGTIMYVDTVNQNCYK